ncbi:MAG TPA: MopE-related protein, partial [Myxococcota bacterium]|nr:MopE-related protein [Myxococcota bacterium]
MQKLLLLPLFLLACNPEGEKPDTDGPKGSLDGDGDGYSIEAGDCDDDNAAVNPAATEVCDGIDQDCTGTADEGLQGTWYADADGDGYGDAVVIACTQPEASSSR